MLSTISNRKFTNVYLIVRIRYLKEISGICYDKEDDWYLYRRETILDAFNRFTTKNDIKLYKKREIYFYLIRGRESIPIDKRKKIEDLAINSGDTIEILTSEKMLETNGVFIYTIKKLKKNNNKCWLVIMIAIILLLLIIAFLLIFKIIKKIKK